MPLPPPPLPLPLNLNLDDDDYLLNSIRENESSDSIPESTNFGSSSLTPSGFSPTASSALHASPREPPLSLWNYSKTNISSIVSANLHGIDEEEPEDPRVALLRLPPPVDDHGDFDYGFSSNPNDDSEEKKESGNCLVASDEDLNDGGRLCNFRSGLENPQSTSGEESEKNIDGNETGNFYFSRKSSNSNPSFSANSKQKSSSHISFRPARSLPKTLRLMKKLGNLFALSSSFIFLLVVFPLLLHSAISDAKKGRTDFAAFYSAASFVVITLVLSFREIFRHLYNWYAPDVQKFVVRILFMVPLYSVQSWLSLRFHGPARVYIDTLRDLYEAFVIQSFVYYLIELLGGEDRMAELLGRKEASLGGHGWFMSKVFGMQRWRMGKEFLLKVKHGVLQYVVVKTILTLLTTFLFLPSGLYGEGTFSIHYAYVYISFILNISVLYALYCLVKLFHAAKSDLRSPINWHPVGKFLCVKGVVFFTWWQGVGIYFLRSHGFIGDIGTWSGDDVANGIIDYLVCIEMVFFSIAHMFTFTYREYLPEDVEEKNTSPRLMSLLFSGLATARRKYGPTSSSDCGSGRRAQSNDPYQTLLGDEDEEVTPCIDEHGNIAEQGSYRPPMTASVMRTLDAPMSLREALWSSTVPRETLDDIKRLGVVSGRQGNFGFRRDAETSISLSSLNNAESI